MPGRRGRRPISTIQDAIASFMQTSGFGKRSLQDQLGRAWCEAIGPEAAAHTRLSRTIRRGILSVEVDSAALLGELGGFRKAEILKVLQEKVKSTYIEDIRFKLGSNF